MANRSTGAVVPPLEASAFGELRASFEGELLRPRDDGYDAARKVWNGLIDRYPVLIARCSGVADVITAVNFAREKNLLVAVRGGGHSVAGYAVCDGGIVIDLSGMKGIKVDPVRRTARAQPGLTLGEFDRETEAFGLATTAGMVSTTGISGLTLGGGIGWLMRKHGLTCDNLLSVEVVTADSRYLTANDRENPDLFWGVRGGGGNFGIITSFEYRLHPVASVLGGMVLHPMKKARNVLRFYRDYTATAPDELTCVVLLRLAPALPSLPQALHGTPAVGMVVCYAGSLEEGERVLRPLRRFGSPLVDLINTKPYTVHQTLLDTGVPAGLLSYWKSEHLRGLTDEAIDTIVAHAARISSPRSNVLIFQLQGAVGRVGEDEMAYGHRAAAHTIDINAFWTEPEESATHIQWTREFWTAMRPFSTGGVLLNFLGDEGTDRVKAAYGPEKYQRLVALKDKYDPTNLFRLNQNIRPTV